MRNLLPFFLLPLLALVLVNEIGTYTHNKIQPDPWPTQYTLTNLPTWCTNKEKVTTQPRIHPNSILNPKLQLGGPTTVPVKATDNTHHHSGSLHYNSKVTPRCCTLMTQAHPPLPRSSTMMKALTTLTKTTIYSTRARSAMKKKNDATADNLQKIVAAEKEVREDKKKKRADKIKAEEETKKKSDGKKAQAKVTADQEKAKASSAPISPPNPDIALEDGATGDDDCPQKHGISPNHLFAMDSANVPEKQTETLDLTGENLPFKK